MLHTAPLHGLNHQIAGPKAAPGRPGATIARLSKRCMQNPAEEQRRTLDCCRIGRYYGPHRLRRRNRACTASRFSSYFGDWAPRAAIPRHHPPMKRACREFWICGCWCWVEPSSSTEARCNRSRRCPLPGIIRDRHHSVLPQNTVDRRKSPVTLTTAPASFIRDLNMHPS